MKVKTAFVTISLFGIAAVLAAYIQLGIGLLASNGCCRF